jgi:hypothetical protein
MADGVRVLDRGDRHVGLRGIERRILPRPMTIIDGRLYQDCGIPLPPYYLG